MGQCPFFIAGLLSFTLVIVGVFASFRPLCLNDDNVIKNVQLGDLSLYILCKKLKSDWDKFEESMLICK